MGLSELSKLFGVLEIVDLLEFHYKSNINLVVVLKSNINMPAISEALFGLQESMLCIRLDNIAFKFPFKNPFENILPCKLRFWKDVSGFV